MKALLCRPQTFAQHGQFIAAVILFVLAASLEPDFLTRFNLSSIAFQYSVIGLIALGQFPVILTAGIDLSQGALIGVTAVLTAMVAQVAGYQFGVVAALLVGVAAGVGTGLLVAFTRIPAFVVTLGMMSIGRGLALTISSGQPVPLLDPSFMRLAHLRIFDIPVSFVFFLACAALLSLFLTQWPLGRAIYAVGGHEENARLTGLDVRLVKICAYGFSGLMCGLAGVLLTAKIGTGHPLSGTGYELVSISAVIIGGGSLFGGIGRTSGIVAGVILLGILDSVLNLSGVSPYVQGTVKGSVVLLALAFSQYSISRSARR
jgi:ribose/xylose/arabinose/galactoside ABC-type transport system permease subunit